MSRPRESDDLESHATVTPTDEERLLTLLGMRGQRSVGEAHAISLVDDVHHSSRCGDIADR
jgi:hypothetical protein